MQIGYINKITLSGWLCYQRNAKTVKDKNKEIEYIWLIAMHHFLIYPFFCFTLSPCAGGFKTFLFSHFVISPFHAVFLPLSMLGSFPWEIFHLINSAAAIHNSWGHVFVFDMTTILTVYSLFPFFILPDTLLFPGIPFHFTPFFCYFDLLLYLCGAPWPYLVNALRIPSLLLSIANNRGWKIGNLRY